MSKPPLCQDLDPAMVKLLEPVPEEAPMTNRTPAKMKGKATILATEEEPEIVGSADEDEATVPSGEGKGMAAGTSVTEDGGDDDDDDGEASEEEEFRGREDAAPRPRLRRLKRGHTEEASPGEVSAKEPRLGTPKVGEPLESSGAPPELVIPMDVARPARRRNILVKAS